MNYVILDMEWNKPISKQRTVRQPIHLHGEIIQIGAVKVNESFEIMDTFNIMVQPKYYTKMNKMVEELTDIHTENINSGVLFPDAASAFRNWCGSDSIILTWGNCDEKMLQDNLILHGLDYEWIPECFDAQLMFDDQITMENRCFPLNYAIYCLGIKPQPAHDALNDAINTLEVIRNLEVDSWIEEKRIYRNEEKYIA